MSTIFKYNHTIKMINFRGSPDQFYRLWTSLFLHAGLIHVVITVLIQWFIMRDLERLIGPMRMAALYFGSGMYVWGIFI